MEGLAGMALVKATVPLAWEGLRVLEVAQQ